MTVDWPNWQPTEVATLMFVVDGGNVLLMRKKRGLGKGKITAPGGRVEAGETLLQCACRELWEEMGLITDQGEWAGELKFEFTDGYRLQVHLFKTDRYRGQASESDEGIPLWTSWDAIPFEEMWADDSLWIPHLRCGQLFVGRFIFEKDRLIEGDVELLGEPASL